MYMKLRVFEKRRSPDGGHRLVPTDKRISVSTVNLAELAQGVVIQHVRWVDNGERVTTEITELAGVFAGRRQLIGVFKIKGK